MKTAFGCFSLLVVLCGCGGCGGSVAEPPKITDPEEVAIKELINSINREEVELKELFVGDAPKKKDIEKFQILFPQLEPEVVVSGDTATVKVEVSQEVEVDGFTESQATVMDWTVKKVDGTWKVDSAPMP